MDSIEIKYKGIPISVDYNFTKGDERVNYYPDGSGYPGSNDEIEIKTIFVSDSNIDILELFSEEQIEELIEIIFESYE